MRALVFCLLASAASAQPAARWADRDVTSVPVPAATAEALDRPVAARASDGEVFVSDFGDYRVERLSASGEWLGALGGESYRSAFRNVSDVAALGDTVWVADMQDRAVTVFTRDGAFVRRMAAPYHVGRLVLVGDEIVTMGLAGQAPLAVLSRNGAVVRWAGRGLGGERLDDFARANAVIRPDRDGGYLYLRLGADAVERYSADGEPRAPVPVAAHAALPDGRPVTGRELRSASVDGPSLWVHVRLAAAEGEAVSALDRYDAATGEYRESVRLPRPFLDVAVLDGRAFGVSDDGLQILDL